MDENKIEYIIFDGIKPNPTVTNTNDGLKILKENNCDFITSFGGGSFMMLQRDTLVVVNEGNIKNYEGIDRLMHPQFLLIAINITVGTASEMARLCIIIDENRYLKWL